MSEVLTNIDSQQIQGHIFTLRGVQVMIDRDLAELYQANLGSGGTKMPRMNWSALKQYPIAIPNIDAIAYPPKQRSKQRSKP